MADDDDITPVTHAIPEPIPSMDPRPFDEVERRHADEHRETTRVLRELTGVLRDLRQEFALNRAQNLRVENLLDRVLARLPQ